MFAILADGFSLRRQMAWLTSQKFMRIIQSSTH